ncbi:MAG: VOC family protein [Anaerolineae bacterium]
MPELCVIGVYVSNLQEARAFYCDKLGFEIVREYGDCILQLKANGITFVVEEIQGDFPAQPCVTIGVRAGDVAEEMARLSDQGVAFFQDAPQPFPAGLFAACQDPDGNLIELLEFTD